MFMQKSEGMTPQITKGWENYVFAKNTLQYILKFIYSFANLPYLSTVEISQNFVAFLKYINFTFHHRYHHKLFA